MNGGGIDPAQWHDLTAPELIELLLHLSGLTSASVVDAINARLADITRAESAAAAKAASLRAKYAHGTGNETASRSKDTMTLIAVLGVLAAVMALFLR